MINFVSILLALVSVLLVFVGICKCFITICRCQWLAFKASFSSWVFQALLGPFHHWMVSSFSCWLPSLGNSQRSFVARCEWGLVSLQFREAQGYIAGMLCGWSYIMGLGLQGKCWVCFPWALKAPLATTIVN